LVGIGRQVLVAVLQVKLEPGQLEKLKAYSKQRGQTMTQLVSAWVNGLGRGGSEKAAEIPAASGGGSEETAVGTAEPVMVSTTLADLSSEELVVLGRRQVELLEQLVALNTGKPVIPVAVAEPAEVVITPPAVAEPAPVEPEPAAPTPALEGVAEVSAGVDEGVDLLAAQRARQLAELEAWGQRYGAEVAAANRAEAAAAMEAAMPSDAPAVKRKASNPEFLEKLKAAAAAAEADADTPMGASQVDDLTEGVSLDDTPERAEGSGTTAVEVLAPADEGPILVESTLLIDPHGV
jgi:lipoprotein-anchoring transpeptidase ErfK/SrfK